MDKQKKSVSYRLPKKIIDLITILSEKLLLSKTAIVILSISHFAEEEKVEDEMGKVRSGKER